MHLKKIPVLIAFIASFLWGAFINFYNLSCIRQQNPANTVSNARSIRYDKTVISIDDYWYIFQMKNYLNGKGFSYNTDSPLNAVRRTPGYPLFYGIHYYLFGEESSFAVIRWTQLLLYAISTIFLLFAAYNFTSSLRIAWLTYFLYLFNLPLASFIFYSITEAVYPSFICCFLFFLSRNKNNPSKINYFITGVILAICILTRPAIIFIVPAVLLLLFFYNKSSLKRGIIFIMVLTSGASCLFIPWIFRNYKVTGGDIVVLEKYYGGDQMDYGMPNMHLKYWIACWENPANLSSESISNQITFSVIHYDSIHTNHLIDSLVHVLPQRAFIGNNPLIIRRAFHDIAAYYKVKKTDSFALGKIKYTDQIASQSFITLKTNFQKAPAGKAHLFLFTPLRYLKSLIIQSNSSSLAFLDNYHGSPLKICLKVLFTLINIFSFASIFIILLWYKKYKDIFWMAFIFSTLTYLIIMEVNKNFEARYIFPLIPILYITAAAVLTESFDCMRKRLHF